MGKRNVNGFSNERLYQVYNGMISRCYNKKHPNYCNWGGRGIEVCNEWKIDYQKFREWALSNGYDFEKSRKEQMIERIDNNKGYNPNNCKWATASEQNKNRRSFKGKGYKYNWTFEGITKSAIDWCDIFNVSVQMVMYRVNEKNMNPFEALTTPVSGHTGCSKVTSEQVIELKEKGMTIKQISEMLDCSITTVARRSRGQH